MILRLERFLTDLKTNGMEVWELKIDLGQMVEINTLSTNLMLPLLSILDQFMLLNIQQPEQLKIMEITFVLLKSLLTFTTSNNLVL